jgi:primosomal replication protein N''
VLLSVPAESWREPPKQQYVSDLLGHFEKRLAAAVSRGPLARFVIGRTTPRIDVVSLETAHRTAEAIVNHVLGRTDVPLPIDPAAYSDDEELRGRLRRLGSHAGMFRRDTGIDGRYLGFPFLLARDARARSAAVKPRIAPVFLWPIAWDLDPAGARASTVAFDREREEVRLNPALEGLLGQAEFARWRSARDDLLAHPGLRVADAMDVLAHLAEPRGRTLVGVPGKDTKLAPGTRALVAAAALFNAEFTGQSVSEDLRQLRGKPLAGTAADVMLRVGHRPAPVAEPHLPERERYLTAACDPSQDDALLRSRTLPGLLIEGPPGTGKSQTIVNIVGEAIGRGESVLVICQKQAALQVVQKRLDAEGLSGRLFSVTDVNRDRDALVRALRDQLPLARSTAPSVLSALRRRREEKAARIESLEGEIDRRHLALHTPVDDTGLSYRSVLGELIGVGSAGPVIEVPRLRPLLDALSAGELSSLEEACGPLAHLWLTSAYEGSPLSALVPFAVDYGVERTLAEDLNAFETAEAARVAALDQGDGFETEEPEPLREWLARAVQILDAMAPETRTRLAEWLDLFRPGSDPETDGGRIAFRLAAIRSGLKRAEAHAPDSALATALAGIDDSILVSGIADLTAHATRPGFLRRLLPTWRNLANRVGAFAAEMGGDASAPFLIQLRRASKREADVRPHRRALLQALSALRLPAAGHHTNAGEVLDRAAEVLASLETVRTLAALVLACPVPEACVAAVRQGTSVAWQDVRDRFLRALVRHGLREASESALMSLTTWFSGTWLADCKSAICQGLPTAALTRPVAGALCSLAAYQRYRARVPGLPPAAVKVFAALRQLESQLLLLSEADLDGVVRRTLRREALLAIKGRLETNHPELLYGREELEAKVSALAALDAEMRALNRELLGRGIDAGKLGSEAAWDDVTRLAGPRKRRLRELLDGGPEIGLMHLRPVWLMNPDVASRVLPLKAGLFDLVVYDEASQMPVEHAVPTLYRAKRAVVSGDEKQMPPSSFFTGTVEDDEDDDVGEMDESATEAERLALEEGWNRREVKDCPDLLQLARSVLGTAMLQIHYRSNYRELIHWEFPRLCRGGSRSLTFPGVCPDFLATAL